MRIKKNDITTPVYNSVDTTTAEGIVTKTWTQGADVRADWQPIGSKTALEIFGIDSVPGDSWHVYGDTSTEFPLNCVAVKDGKNYQCIGIRPWYSHVECVFVPWSGSLT